MKGVCIVSGRTRQGILNSYSPFPELEEVSLVGRQGVNTFADYLFAGHTSVKRSTSKPNGLTGKMIDHPPRTDISWPPSPVFSYVAFKGGITLRPSPPSRSSGARVRSLSLFFRLQGREAGIP